MKSNPTTALIGRRYPTPGSPMLELMLARHDMTENLYKKMEEHLPCEPMSDAMLTAMNKSLGFSGDHAKTRDYRPYCVRQGCKDMPRMMRDPKGFRCWSCHNIWVLSENSKANQSEP